MNPKVLVFDWDGTLFDSMSYKVVNAGLVFARHYQVSADRASALFLKHTGVPRQELFGRIATGLGVPFSESVYQVLSEAFTKANLSSSETAGLFADAREVLPLLSRQNPLYVSSASDPAELMVLVERVGIGAFFCGVWGSRPGFSKGREHFARVCELQACSPADILFVGNDEQDGVLARESRVGFVRVCRDAGDALAGPEMIVSLGSLNKMLEC